MRDGLTNHGPTPRKVETMLEVLSAASQTANDSPKGYVLLTPRPSVYCALFALADFERITGNPEVIPR